MIASIDNLIVMKRAANRPKDQLDIAALEKIKRGEEPNEYARIVHFRRIDVGADRPVGAVA